MAPKNPFVNCKSRKRRKAKVNVPKQPKVYCPRLMVRYDDSPNEYNTVFICKMCMTCVLDQNAVPAHIQRCAETFKKPVEIVEPVKKNVEELRYICEVCNKVFSRKVTLKKHREQHEEESGMESDDEVFVASRKRTKLVKNRAEEYQAETETEAIDDTNIVVNDN